MKIKVLAEDQYRVTAVVDGDNCPAESFILEGEATTSSARSGLNTMLQKVAEKGLSGIPAAWIHEVSKKDKIYEFKKGPLRLFFFKGEGIDIVICTLGVRKSGQKVDKGAVDQAAKWRTRYQAAIASNSCEVIEVET